MALTFPVRWYHYRQSIGRTVLPFRGTPWDQDTSSPHFYVTLPSPFVCQYQSKYCTWSLLKGHYPMLVQYTTIGTWIPQKTPLIDAPHPKKKPFMIFIFIYISYVNSLQIINVQNTAWSPNQQHTYSFPPPLGLWSYVAFKEGEKSDVSDFRWGKVTLERPFKPGDMSCEDGWIVDSQRSNC